MKVIRMAALGAVAAVIAAGAGFSAAALGSQRARADVRVSSGTAAVTTSNATRAQPRPAPVISGSFKVHNAGTLATTHFRGWVRLTAARRSVLIRDYAGSKLKPGHTETLTLSRTVPAKLAPVSWTIQACVVLGTSYTTKPAKDGCRALGTYKLAPASSGSQPTTTTTAPTTTTQSPAPTTTATNSPGTSSATTTTPTTTIPAPTGPVDTAPTSPATGYTVDQPFFEADGLGQYRGTANTAPQNNAYSGGFYTSGYWVDVPASYDESNQTPETLLVWNHGCGGVAIDDLGHITSEYSSDRPYIVISLNGPEDAYAGSGPDCWDTGSQTDVTKVLHDIAQVETEFNIDRRRVIIGGYSSGGDLSWQTIFLHADTFAGILVDNTNPVRDNTFGPNGINTAIAGAAWKFNGIQLSHSHDDIYHVDPCGFSSYGACEETDPSGYTSPDVGVRPQITALDNASFPVTLRIADGNHYNNDAPSGCYGNGNGGDTPACTSGTYYDIYHQLLATIPTDGWEAPAS